MPNYQDGKIYKIESPQTDQVYIGSTTQKLCDRMTNHRSDFKCRKGNCTSLKLLEYGDAKIYLIELFPCNSKEELEAREGHWQKEMRGLGLLINIRTAGKSDKKKLDRLYYEKNKEAISSYQTEYRKKNNDELKIYKKKYAEINKDKIKEHKDEYRELNREKINDRKRQTYQDNRDKILKQKNDNYEKNRDVINARRRELTKCDVCSKSLTRASLSNHKKVKHPHS